MKKIVTFGEVLLRLTTPGNLRFSQSRDYVATFGGSETNVAVSLANFGIPTEFVTRLPDNDIARACISDSFTWTPYGWYYLWRRSYGNLFS